MQSVWGEEFLYWLHFAPPQDIAFFEVCMPTQNVKVWMQHTGTWKHAGILNREPG